MYLLYFLLFVIGVTSVTCDDSKSPPEVYIYDLEDAEFHFKEFIKNFDKNYGEEYDYRFGVFKENLKKINSWNVEENFNVHAITQFTDMTEKEFLEYANCYNDFGLEDMNLTDSNFVNVDSLPVKNYPAELDYRTRGLVTEAKNQGGCNDCYIFSAVGNIEGQYAKRYGRLLSLSEKEVLDCMNVGGCNSGNPYNVMQSVASFGGLVSEWEYPYRPVQSACNVNRNHIVARVARGNRLAAGEYSLMAALNNYGPMSIAIHASVKMQTFSGGRVFKEANCIQSSHNHVVLVIGYGTAPDGPYWLIKNSWGSSWAEQGFFRLARGVNMCGIGQYPSATATIA